MTVIAIIRSELWFSSGWWWNGWWYTSSSSVCYMTTGAVSSNICTYGYWVGAVGIFCSFFLFFTGVRAALNIIHSFVHYGKAVQTIMQTITTTISLTADDQVDSEIPNPSYL